MKNNASLLLLSLVHLIVLSGTLAVYSQSNHSDTQPQLATLLAQHKHKSFATANFNFMLGVRGDSKAPATFNIYDVRFGSLTDNNDSDWFEVPISHGSCSQIVDLGILDWSNIYAIPFLYASPIPHPGPRNYSYRNGKWTSTPEHTLVKAIAGHMYLLRSKDEKKDFYVMFRVDSLKPSDEVTISWKIVPSPEGSN